MPKIESSINTRSAEFAANARAMRTQISDYGCKAEKITLGGSESARKKHTERGKLLVRERIRNLIDTGTPFLELSLFAGWEMYGGEIRCRGNHYRYWPGKWY